MKAAAQSLIKPLMMLCFIAWTTMTVSGCSHFLPSLEGRSMSRALDQKTVNRTRLGQVSAQLVSRHARSGNSGIHPLPAPGNALAVRLQLVQTAQRSLDVQYYIWRADVSGFLLLHELFQAAERGVRVRLLLDDNGISGLDDILIALNHHPRIEVRLFNPFTLRHPKWINYLTDFTRINRRMHNKSFTADNAVTIIGGRNIGDEYFGVTHQEVFADMDVLAIGPVVGRVSAAFDAYWASASAYPVERVVQNANQQFARQWLARMEQLMHQPKARRFLQTIGETDTVTQLLSGRLALVWAATTLVADDPVKAQGKARAEQLLAVQLEQVIGTPMRDVKLVSPYFVPTRNGTEAFINMARRGVKVQILTNSLSSTDVSAVHAGYAKWRKSLLRGGVTLYEMRNITNQDEKGGISSASSLHAKTFAIDGERVFVGSFNFDPRSARLNTEMGFIIESPQLARRMAQRFVTRIPQDAYETRLDGNGQLYWLERRGQQVLRHDTEPGTRPLQRATVFLLSVLPIEWLL
ncbi:MAG: phospholipase D family protein [Thiothrix sp.]|nr:phospholipase D family protein [Thiothrix sp.]HPQ93954.1 phospholipase D family protein [Thiolinea sp.]